MKNRFSLTVWHSNTVVTLAPEVNAAIQALDIIPFSDKPVGITKVMRIGNDVYGFRAPGKLITINAPSSSGRLSISTKAAQQLLDAAVDFGLLTPETYARVVESVRRALYYQEVRRESRDMLDTAAKLGVVLSREQLNAMHDSMTRVANGEKLKTAHSEDY